MFNLRACSTWAIPLILGRGSVIALMVSLKHTAPFHYVTGKLEWAWGALAVWVTPSRPKPTQILSLSLFFCQVSEEADGIRESLSQLRQSIPAQDTQQGAIDQLEKHISELMSKLMERSSSPTGKKSRRHVSCLSVWLLGGPEVERYLPLLGCYTCM